MKSTVYLLFFTFISVFTPFNAQILTNDPNFNCQIGFDVPPTDVIKLNNGQFLFTGNFTTYNGNNVNNIFKVNSNGSIDPTFNVSILSNIQATIARVRVQQDGKIVLLYTPSSSFGSSIFCHLVRLNSNGSIDNTFTPLVLESVYNSALSTYNYNLMNTFDIQSNSKIIVGGYFTSIQGIPRKSIARLNPDGSLDQSFNPGAGLELIDINGTTLPTVSEISVFSNDEFIISGGFNKKFNLDLPARFAKFDANGEIDLNFTSNHEINLNQQLIGFASTIYVDKFKMQTDGKIIIGGLFTDVNGTLCTGLSRLNPNGTLDNSFQTMFTGIGSTPVSSIDIQADGKILLATEWQDYFNIPRKQLVRLLPNGLIDNSFYLESILPDANYSITKAISLSNEKAVIIGNFSEIEGETRNGLAMLNFCGNASTIFANSCGVYNWTETNTDYYQSGVYTSDTLSNMNGCDSLSTLVLTVEPAVAPPICVVSLDSLTNRNRIVWEKPFSNSIDSFHVYRETSFANQYELIGSQDYDDLSVFIDINGNPQIQAYRYKLLVSDTCGSLSSTVFSEHHKTVHLTINQGIGNTWNLIWTPYEGVIVPTYNIYRGTSPTNMIPIASVQGNNTSFTDINAPGGDVYYQIEFENPQPCTPSRAQDYNSSRSNIASNTPMGLNSEGTITIKLWPNPVHNIVSIETNETIKELLIYTMQGELISSDKFTKTMDVSTLSSGIYQLVIETESQKATLPLLKQ